MSTLTVRLTDREDRDLQLACEQTGKTKSEVVRDLLAESLRGYRLRQSLQAAHAELGGAARQAGWLTEDAVKPAAPVAPRPSMTAAAPPALTTAVHAPTP